MLSRRSRAAFACARAAGFMAPAAASISAAPSAPRSSTAARSADLRFRARRPRHIDLVILADISGSGAILLDPDARIGRGAVDGNFRRVRSFVFIDRLAEAEFAAASRDDACRWISTRVRISAGCSANYGSGAELLSRATVMVIMGDGRNNRAPARADLLRDMRRLCRAVVLADSGAAERWGTGDSAIFQYAREIDALHRCANLGELERSLERSIRSAF